MVSKYFFAGSSKPLLANLSTLCWMLLSSATSQRSVNGDRGGVPKEKGLNGGSSREDGKAKRHVEVEMNESKEGDEVDLTCYKYFLRGW